MDSAIAIQTDSDDPLLRVIDVMGLDQSEKRIGVAKQVQLFLGLIGRSDVVDNELYVEMGPALVVMIVDGPPNVEAL